MDPGMEPNLSLSKAAIAVHAEAVSLDPIHMPLMCVKAAMEFVGKLSPEVMSEALQYLITDYYTEDEYDIQVILPRAIEFALKYAE
jgi:hypothetical protein